MKKQLPVFLGVMILTFGALKFLNPTIAGWFATQIQGSHLPRSAILTGKLGEIMTGLLFLLPRLRRMSGDWERRLSLIAGASLLVEMLVAVYVHLQPGVPASVLPLGIKPPVVPLVVICLDLMVLVSWLRDGRGRVEKVR